MTFSVFGGTDNISVQVNAQTELEDDLNDIEPFSLDDLAPGDFIEMEAFDDGTDVINAVEIERDEMDDVQLEGPVSAFNAETMSVTMLGQQFVLPATAKYENDFDVEYASPAHFFADLVVGSFIELTDEDPDGPNLPDGVIDKVELEEQDDD